MASPPLLLLTVKRLQTLHSSIFLTDPRLLWNIRCGHHEDLEELKIQAELLFIQ